MSWHDQFSETENVYQLHLFNGCTACWYWFLNQAHTIIHLRLFRTTINFYGKYCTRYLSVTNRLTESKNTKCTVLCNCNAIWKWLLSKLGIWSLKKNQITTKRNPISNLELYNMHKVCTTLPWVHDQKQCKRKVSRTETDKRKRQASSLPHSKLCHSWSINHLAPIKRKNR